MSRQYVEEQGEQSAEQHADPAVPAPPRAINTPQDALAMQGFAGNAAVARVLARKAAPATAEETPEEMVKRHLGTINNDEEGIARECLRHIKAKPEWVYEAFEHIPDHDRDDVASYFMDLAFEDKGVLKLLDEVARDPAGKRTLLRIVKELGAGWTTAGEQGDMQELLKAIGHADSADPVGMPRDSVVEVLTFDSGSLDAIPKFVDRDTQLSDERGQPAPLGALAEQLTGRRQLGKGVRGHTAVVIDGVVFSFELEWSIGGSKDDYVSAKQKAGHGGSAIKITMSNEDAKKLRDSLIGKVDTGAYLVGGEGICVDAAAAQLQQVLTDLPKHDRYDVQQFRDKLRSSPYFAGETPYPAAKQPAAGH